MDKIPERPDPMNGYGSGRQRSRRYLLHLTAHEHAVAVRAVEALRRIEYEGWKGAAEEKDAPKPNAGLMWSEAQEAIDDIEQSGWVP